MPLVGIRTDGGTQPRAALDPLVVDDYAEALDGGAKLPPAVVFHDGTHHWLADGFHRYAAYEAAGREGMPVEVRQGTQREAILYSVGANDAHGLPRTHDDKRRAVLRLLHDDVWRSWSNRAIAKACRVGHEMVGRLRTSAEQRPEASSRTSGGNGQIRKVRRGGKIYPMDVSRIGADPGISKQARDAVRATSLREDPKLMRKLATVPPSDQVRVVKMLSNGEAKTVAQAVRVLSNRAKTASLAAAAALAPPLTAEDWVVTAGDCLQVLATVPRESVRLIFADPPYNIGIDYGQGAAADRQSDDQYLAWCEQWMAECIELLTPDGALWVVINDEYAAEYVLTLKRKLKLYHRAWVKWYETFGVNCTDNFNRTSRHLLYFTRNPDQFVFHRHVFNRPSARQVLYNDGRAQPGGKVWDDVWAIPRLVGNAEERLPGFPTQLPQALVSPIIAGCSDSGDLVLDPFAGSCTSGVACVQHERRFRGIELNPEYAAAGQMRIAACVQEQRRAESA